MHFSLKSKVHKSLCRNGRLLWTHFDYFYRGVNNKVKHIYPYGIYPMINFLYGNFLKPVPSFTVVINLHTIFNLWKAWTRCWKKRKQKKNTLVYNPLHKHFYFMRLVIQFLHFYITEKDIGCVHLYRVPISCIITKNKHEKSFQVPFIVIAVQFFLISNQDI